MRVIVVDKNQFVDCIDDVIQTQLFVNDKLVIEKSYLKLSFIPLASISSIGCQDLDLEKMDRKHKRDKINLLLKVKKYFCAEELDGDEIPTGDWIYTKDAVEIAQYIDKLIQELEGKNEINFSN